MALAPFFWRVPTKPPETKGSGACGYPERSSQQSPNFGSRNSNIAEERRILASPFARHSAGSKSRQANGAETDTPGRPAPSKSEPQIPSDPAENPPSEAILQVGATGVK